MTLLELQDVMRRQAQEDKNQKSVNVSGPSIQEALRKAAIELGVGVKKLEYEVLVRGSDGVFGMGKKDFTLTVYTARTGLEFGGSSDEESLDFGSVNSNDHDGVLCIRKGEDGVWVKVSAPIGSGRRITEHEAVDKIELKTTERIDTALLSKVVRRADDEWVRVAECQDYDPNQDSQIIVQIRDLEMKAYVELTKPGPKGADPNASRIRSVLQMNNVQFGILEDVLQQLEDAPEYGDTILVAEGKKAKHGDDAKIIFSFDTAKKLHLKELDNGRVDFKEINSINNVVAGQVLAKLEPAQRGESGMTVTGKPLPAKDGKDKQFVIGNNVKLSDDKRQAIASTNGQVIVQGEKISVEEILTVDGNVNLKTSNIVFLGSVVVTGNVEDGFSVKAAGNIEVHGTIEKCEIDCEGDVIVYNGITGKSGAKIRAGGNVWAKFIENATVEAGGIVVVSEGIVNSNVSCDHKIICRGKRAFIVGGIIRASEEIDAKNLGSPAGVDTVLEVGFDPKLKTELDGQHEQLKHAQKEKEDLDTNFQTLDKLIQARRDSVPQEKKDQHESLKKNLLAVKAKIQGIQEEIAKLNKQANELKSTGKISASGKVYPGCSIIINGTLAPIAVKSEYRAVSFVPDQNIIKVTRYEESDQDISSIKDLWGDSK